MIGIIIKNNEKKVFQYLIYGKNGADCYSKNGHAVTVLMRQS